jgi:hypothetical protein
MNLNLTLSSLSALSESLPSSFQQAIESSVSSLEELSASLHAALPASIPKEIVLPRGFGTLPTLAAPLALALLVLARAGIVGASNSRSQMEYTVKWNRERSVPVHVFSKCQYAHNGTRMIHTHTHCAGYASRSLRRIHHSPRFVIR